MIQKNSKAVFIKGILKALGLVFGDIGTSPIYTMTVVFLFLEKTYENIIGILSLIIWTITLLVTIQFAWLAMSLSIRGEGGKIVLKEILLPLVKSKRSAGIVSMIAIIGVSLLIGDGVITPAISIMSAVEGLDLIPSFERIYQSEFVFISVIIAIILFYFQKKGAEKVAGAFGPIMFIWFISLAFSGIVSILYAPQILLSINPYYAFNFLIKNGLIGFIVLGEVILCATGGEALYADMGHLGSNPIRMAWIGVFIALVLNYFGQGAYLLKHPEAKNILFEMIFFHAQNLYIPFLLLSIIATIIASQAMISGTFSIVYQGITTRLMPMFKVDYTSEEKKSQIYIPSVNWFLLIAVIIIMLEFGKSSRLATAYGLAVTGTMVLTGILMVWIFYLKKKRLLAIIALFITAFDIIYFLANLYKIPHGGYWSILISIIPFTMIMLYIKGQKKLYRMIDFMSLEEFLHKFKRVYNTTTKLKGTSLFLLKDVNVIPFYITQTIFFHGIIYEDNIFVSIIKRDDPYGVTGYFRENLSEGLRFFEIQMGYMEIIDVEEILKEAGIEERVVFYGLEDIVTNNIIWKLFAFIKKITPTFIQFYKFPPKKLHGVFTKVWL
jgi:KUP system potassium uptake protein